jgi:carbon storage regulator
MLKTMTIHVAQGEATMLVLTRKKNESIVIAENIVVTVIDIRRDRVRLGIAAPKEVAVNRQEVYEKIKHSSKVDGASRQPPASEE